MLKSTFLVSFVPLTNGSVFTRFLMESPKTFSLSAVKPRTRSMLLMLFLKPMKPGKVSFLVLLTRRILKCKFKRFWIYLHVRYTHIVFVFYSVNTAVEDSPYKVDNVEVPAVSFFVFFFVFFWLWWYTNI